MSGRNMTMTTAFTNIDGLHLTSWPPCWRYNTEGICYLLHWRRGWLTLSATSREIDCKPRILFKRKYKLDYSLEHT